MEPTFSWGSVPGIDSPWIQRRGAWQTGLVLQYEKDPLLLYMFGEEEGVVLADRATVAAGVSYDWSERLTTRLVLPASMQGGGQVPELAADGMGLRDLRLGGRIGLASAGFISTALTVDLWVPTGTDNAYMGEVWPRGAVGLAAGVDAGRPKVLVDVGFVGRQAVRTDYDFTLGSELLANASGRYGIWPSRLDAHAGILTRAGLSSLGTGGGAYAAELLGGLIVQPHRKLQVDLGVGKGITDGYGTTTFRTYFGLTWKEAPPPAFKDRPKVIAAPTRAEIMNQAVVSVEEKTEEVPWKEGELARIEKMSITIREPIQFEFATAKILPESMPILHSIAGLLNDYWQIKHLVIEGHASEEGTFQYNFDLSVSRARSIFQALVEAGVDPDRLSFKGMGEVRARVAGASEDALAANRRVEFRIVELLQPLDPKPPYANQTLLPWTGALVPLTVPGDKVLGADEPVAPQDPGDQQAVDILKQYLKEDEKAEEPSTPPKDGSEKKESPK